MSAQGTTNQSNRWLHWFAYLTALATFFLIIAGASVTSNRAGLAVPDWPTTYGHFMFAYPLSKMVGNIFYEHGHRLIASTVGILTIILSIWLIRKEPRKWVRQLGIAALAAVIVQGVLGGLTVKYFLPAPISVAHAAIAQAFFCMVITLAIVTSKKWSQRSKNVRPGVFWFSLITTVVVYLQIILGAAIRHGNVSVLPHAIGAVAVILCGGTAAMAIFTTTRRRDFMWLSTIMGFLIFAQLWLGAATWVVRVPKDISEQLTTLQILIPTIHMIIGVLILATSFVITLKSFRDTESITAPKTEQLSAYWELAKPRIVTMVLVTVALGYFLGAQRIGISTELVFALVGIACTTAGASVLNNFIERDIDAKMIRTRDRAIPSGRVTASNALAYGVTLVMSGLFLLVLLVNMLTAFLVLLAAFLYILVYTPMKRLTWFNTTIGAIPGAIPPLCGWAAATGELGVGAWILFSIMFTWQHPHFFAIAWIFKDDYRSAGLKMLPVVEPSGRGMSRQTLVYSVLLLIVSLLPTMTNMAGQVYFYGALVLGLMMLSFGILFTVARTLQDARRLLHASIIYLPVLLVLIIIDARF